MQFHIVCVGPVEFDDIVHIWLEDFGKFSGLYLTRNPNVISKATGRKIFNCEFQVVDVIVH